MTVLLLLLIIACMSAPGQAPGHDDDETWARYDDFGVDE